MGRVITRVKDVISVLSDEGLKFTFAPMYAKHYTSVMISLGVRDILSLMRAYLRYVSYHLSSGFTLLMQLFPPRTPHLSPFIGSLV